MDYIISTQYMTHTGHRWEFEYGAVYRIHHIGGNSKANVVAKTLRYLHSQLGSAEMEYPTNIMTHAEWVERFGKLSTEFLILLNYEKDLAKY